MITCSTPTISSPLDARSVARRKFTCASQHPRDHSFRCQCWCTGVAGMRALCAKKSGRTLPSLNASRASSRWSCVRFPARSAEQSRAEAAVRGERGFGTRRRPELYSDPDHHTCMIYHAHTVQLGGVEVAQPKQDGRAVGLPFRAEKHDCFLRAHNARQCCIAS